jgi:hypothetical protein
MFIKFDSIILYATNYQFFKHQNDPMITAWNEHHGGNTEWTFSTFEERDAKFSELENKLLGES